MKTLPKYYCIKRDKSNPLWKKYIDWLNKTYDEDWRGNAEMYYGYDGGVKYHGTNYKDNLLRFENKTQLITLEFWNECVNGKKIVGYKAPLDVIIKEGDVIKLEYITSNFETVYEEEKLEIIDNKYYPATNYSQLTINGKLTQEKVDKIKEVINE